MLNPVSSVQVEQEKPKLKEMLTWNEDPDKITVKINYSSLSLLSTCLRKANYSLQLNLRQTEQSTALAFGSAIHKALEHWYQLPVADRQLPKSQEEQAGLMAFGHSLEEPTTGALECIRQFCLMGSQSSIAALEEGDKRSMASGVRILKAYFRHYAQDGFVVATDSQGPLVERMASAPLCVTSYLGKPVHIHYFGTVDCILKNEQTGILMVADHKTTATLGKEFYDRCKPNPQYTGYVWLAREALGIQTNLFMINGLQTAKTKTEFARQVTERTEDDFQELKLSVAEQVVRWLRAVQLEQYPMTSPDPCSMYGGCQYRKLCELPASLRENVIKLEYQHEQVST